MPSWGTAKDGLCPLFEKVINCCLLITFPNCKGITSAITQINTKYSAGYFTFELPITLHTPVCTPKCTADQWTLSSPLNSLLASVSPG